MNHCRFYLIHSKKSEEDINGIKKILFGSENRGDSYGFIWIDKEEEILHLQFIFGELVLEWLPEKGLKFSQTNRAIDTPEGIGYQKGARVLHPVENKEEINKILEYANNAKYPKKWSGKIFEKLKNL